MGDSVAGIPRIITPNLRVHNRCDHTKLLSDVREAILGGFQHNGAVLGELESFPRLLQAMECILVHGMRIFKPDGSPDLWRFIEALSWLNPSMAVSVAHTNNLSPVHIPHSRIKSNRALVWLYECLKSHTLSVKLSWLLSDFEHLSHCYEATAFLRAEKFTRALFLCLDAVESGQIDAIWRIDPKLLLEGHRRSSSHPEFPAKMGNKPSLKINYDSPEEPEAAEATEEPAKPIVRIRKKSKKSRTKRSRKSRLKASSSLPNIPAAEREPRARSMTITQPISIPYTPVRLTAESLEQNSQKVVPSFSYRTSRDAGSECGGSASKATPTDLMPIQLVKCDDIKIHFDKRYTPKTPASANDTSPAVQVPEAAEACSSSVNTPTQRNLFSVLSTKKSLYPYLDLTLEKGESSGSNGTPFHSNLYVSPSPGDFMNTFIPLPGEKIRNRYRKSSLLEGLSSSPLGTPTTSRVEQGSRQPMRGQSLASYLQSAQFSQTNSDLERENAHFSVCDAMIAAIEQLKWTKIEKEESRGREKRYVRTRSRLKRWDEEVGVIPGASSSPDVCSSTESSEVSFENVSMFNESNSSDDMRLSESSNTNDHVAYAEWGENTLEALSAEGVALSLISKFSDKQLPRASELLWMSPDNEPMATQSGMTASTFNGGHQDRFRINSVLRGTKDWAPPRAQIIFTRHASPNRKELITQQNFRCAGCGMHVAKAYFHKLRYCAYIGKYHCTGCHRNQISAIPARVLERWDFSCHPVSVFSYRLLDQIWAFPLFRIMDLNPTLYDKVRVLNLARMKRNQLRFIEDFIRSCRFATKVQKLFENIPNHLTMDVDVWSMVDLMAVKNGSFKRDVSLFIENCEEHILGCELCTARGFFCELCSKKTVIFPWQPNIRRCSDCGTCVHDNCWHGECPKCQRLRQRRRSEGTKSTCG